METNFKFKKGDIVVYLGELATIVDAKEIKYVIWEYNNEPCVWKVENRYHIITEITHTHIYDALESNLSLPVEDKEYKHPSLVVAGPKFNCKDEVIYGGSKFKIIGVSEEKSYGLDENDNPIITKQQVFYNIKNRFCTMIGIDECSLKLAKGEK